MSENKFTPRAEEALRLSQEAAEEMGHGYVGSEHLLLGLIREEDGVAHRVLSEFGVTDEMVGLLAVQHLGQHRGETPYRVRGLTGLSTEIFRR